MGDDILWPDAWKPVDVEAAESDRKNFPLQVQGTVYEKSPSDIHNSLPDSQKWSEHASNFHSKIYKQPQNPVTKYTEQSPKKKRLSYKVGLPIIHPRFPMLFAASEIHSKQVVSIAQQRAHFSWADSSFPHGNVESHVFLFQT